MQVLTILHRLHYFRIARLSLHRSVEWCHEEFILGELLQIRDHMHLRGGIHHRQHVVLLRAPTQIPESDVQTFHVILGATNLQLPFQAHRCRVDAQRVY